MELNADAQIPAPAGTDQHPYPLAASSPSSSLGSKGAVGRFSWISRLISWIKVLLWYSLPCPFPSDHTLLDSSSNPPLSSNAMTTLRNSLTKAVTSPILRSSGSECNNRWSTRAILGCLGEVVFVEKICRGWVPDNPSPIISCISRCACFSFIACCAGGGVRVDEKGRDKDVPSVLNPDVLQLVAIY